jgi:hypothetical protein
MELALNVPISTLFSTGQIYDEALRADDIVRRVKLDFMFATLSAIVETTPTADPWASQAAGLASSIVSNGLMSHDLLSLGFDLIRTSWMKTRFSSVSDRRAVAFAAFRLGIAQATATRAIEPSDAGRMLNGSVGAILDLFAKSNPDMFIKLIVQ